MPMHRAKDFPDKRRALLKEAARLYAAHGRAISLDKLSALMGRSHNYCARRFPTKPVLVFALLDQHLDDLLAAAEANVPPADPRGGGDPLGRLEGLAAGYLGYAMGAGADAHRVYRPVLHWVRPAEQRRLIAKQRQILRVFADALVRAAPELAARPEWRMPLTLSLFAMLNEAPHWLGIGVRRTRVRGDTGEGALGVADYARLATSCVVYGAASVERESETYRAASLSPWRGASMSH